MRHAGLLVCAWLAGTVAAPAQVIVLPGTPARPAVKPSATYSPPRMTAPTTTPLPLSPVPFISNSPYPSAITVTRRRLHEVQVVSRGLQISNVVLQFADGSRQRYEDVASQFGSFSGSGAHAGKSITTVCVKAGPNFSGDGPGYGERFEQGARAVTDVLPARR